MHPLMVYVLCVVLLILLDSPYLYLNNELYKLKTLSISGKGYTKRYYSVIIVYLALALGIIFLVLPRMRINSYSSSNTTANILSRIQDSVLYGGVFGLASYATFDFTMHFMFDKWDLSVSIMDSIWGSVLCSSVAFIISHV